jgi:ubiquinone/menaquinone biosynthesis C-methylase UbiE
MSGGMSWDEQRQSFGAVAEIYDSNRPEWPAATAAWLTGAEPGGPLSAKVGGLDVLDLGAGTGKLTRTLVEAGHRVTAVDPSEGMLAVLSASLPQVQALVGTGEAIPAGANSTDVVTVAQAWHWMDPSATPIECARVLRPGGLLAIGWHRRVLAGWVAELEELAEAPTEQLPASVRSHGGLLQFPAVFGELEHTTFEYEQRLTPEQLVALTSSWSYVITRPDREQVLARVESLGRREAGSDGLITLPHVTHCYRAVLQAPPGDPI